MNNSEGIKTLSFKSLPSGCELFKIGGSREGSVRINGEEFVFGGDSENSLALSSSQARSNHKGWDVFELLFESGQKLPDGLEFKLVYEAPKDINVLIKSVVIENNSDDIIRVDGMCVEAFSADLSGPMSLMLENDYVRGAMKVNGENARSAWIEGQPDYVKSLLNTSDSPTRFEYPVELDQWISPSQKFTSFKVYEFIVPVENEELRGVAFRKATRKLFPWTCNRHLNCTLSPARAVEEYYRGIDSAADAGYEFVLLCHGWLDGILTPPIFTNYNDYELRPELFPNGWSDVRKMTDYAHSKGLGIYFYTIYKETWHMDGWREGFEIPKVQKDNDWELIWADDDESPRWGPTLDPGTDWGLFVNRKIEESIVNGGFDGWHLDGPYYGDVSVAENRGYKAGGPNQFIGWERQKQFYQRMKSLGYHGEAAQGFCGFPHGMNRITTTGYDEGDFGTMEMKGQILATRRGAYIFTKVYRPEQAITFIPVVAWSPEADAPCLEPMEENAELYEAYLSFCFGYGFEGRTFQRVAFEGPKSEAAVRRWLGFWKEHSDYFKKGYLLHLRIPDGENIDAVAHYLVDGESHKLLVVAYNPTEEELSDELSLPFDVVPGGSWRAACEDGGEQVVEDGKLKVTVGRMGAVWYELEFEGK